MTARWLMTWAFAVLAAASTAGTPAAAADTDATLSLLARSRTADTADPQLWHAQREVLHWDAAKTAVIICDMWDKHWCRGASARVAEMAPRVDAFAAAARRRGALIVHCPSGTMDFYKDTPQRKLALAAPPAKPKTPLQGWRPLDLQREGPLPIDDRDGGCDTPGDKSGRAWTRQIATIHIAPSDAIGDGFEVFNLLEQRGIENLVIVGVHTNMCVLGRPFGIRQMVDQGKHVVLVRDLTDAMYNPQARPFVSHWRGKDLVVEHVEKHWCPTIESSDLLGGPAFCFAADRRPRVVFLVSEDEYGAEASLSDYADWLAEKYDYHCTLVTGRGKEDLSGVEELKTADVAVLFIRRRALPKPQLDAIRAYLAAGKPLVALRTASHAFAVRGQAPAGLDQWPTFDADVLGCHYANHTGNALGTDVHPVPQTAGNALLHGVRPTSWHSPGSLYKSTLVDDHAVVLLTGSAGDASFPVAWTRSYGKARVFYTSLGHRDDFAQPQFRTLLVNALAWAMGRPATAAQPPAGADRAGGDR